MNSGASLPELTPEGAASNGSPPTLTPSTGWVVRSFESSLSNSPLRSAGFGKTARRLAPKDLRAMDRKVKPEDVDAMSSRFAVAAHLDD